MEIKKYTQYRSSGDLWITEVPRHWQTYRLKYVAEANPSNIDKKTVEREQHVLLCNYVDVYKNEFITEDLNLMAATASADQIDRFQLETGDVLVTKDSEDPSDIAIPAVVKKDMPGVVCGYHLTHIRANPKMLNGFYLHRLFQSYTFNQQFTVKANGVTRYGLSAAAFTEAVVCCPPLPEQQAIASYLDKKTALIDSTIRQKERLIELLQEERTAIINQAVTRGLDPNVKIKDSGVEWLGKVPEHWEVRKLGRSYSMIGSGTTPTSSEGKYYKEGTVNWINTGDLNDKVLNSCTKKVTEKALADFSTLKVYPTGSIVMALYGATIGKLSILNIEACTNQACCVLTKSPYFINRFLFYWLYANRPHIISLAYGGGQPNISQDLVRSLRVPSPPLKEQKTIISYVDLKLSNVDETINSYHKQILLLQEYRTSLINDVVTGKICVK